MVREIELLHGEVAFIDNNDYDLISRYKWHAQRSKKSAVVYAMTTIQVDGKHIKLPMHRLILDFPDDEVDHENGNGLDNQRSNLRPATRSENMRNRGKQRNNTSGYVGVHFFKRAKRWRAYIKLNGKQIHIGYFATALEAAKARDKAAIELHGTFAKLNFPMESQA